MRWIYTFHRELPLALIYLANKGYTEEMFNQVGWAFRNVLFVSRNGFEKSYRGEEDEVSFREFIKKELDRNPNFIVKIMGKMKKFSQDYESIIKKIKQINPKEKNNKELLDLYQKACEAELRLDSVFQFPVYFDKFVGLFDYKIIKEIKEAAKLRDACSKLFYDTYRENYAGLFTEVGRRFNMRSDLVKYATPQEIFETLTFGKSSIPEKILKQRYEFYVLITKNGCSKLLIGKKAEKVIEEELKEEISQVNELFGSCACAGKVQGTARIVKGESELNKLQKDDIIISPMTTVTFVPHLGKVKGIVTDEGGITSHASIISRELNKPAVIGTNNATQVIKDGDLIEVDADKGIVRILHKERKSA